MYKDTNKAFERNEHALRFAASYNRKMERPSNRQKFDPLRRETAGLAQGVVLEVGVGGGQNFSFYDPTQVTRVEAVEPGEAMLALARRRLVDVPVPIHLSRARAEALPFPDAQFDSVVVTLVFCSVDEPMQGLREIWRVLKPGGRFFLFEHVRAQARGVAWLQDALVPLTTRYGGNCHWNRDTTAMVQEIGFRATQIQRIKEVFQPIVLLHAIRPPQREDMPAHEQ